MYVNTKKDGYLTTETLLAILNEQYFYKKQNKKTVKVAHTYDPTQEDYE